MKEKEKSELIKRKEAVDDATVKFAEAEEALDKAVVRYIEEKIKSEEEK